MKKLTCFSGIDLAGDACIYIQEFEHDDEGEVIESSKRYLTEDEITKYVEDLNSVFDRE